MSGVIGGAISKSGVIGRNISSVSKIFGHGNPAGLTITATNYSVQQSSVIVFNDSESYSMWISFSGEVTSGTPSALTFTVAGITTPNNQLQSLSRGHNDRAYNVWANSNSGSIVMERHNGSFHSIWNCSGIIDLASRPTWY